MNRKLIHIILPYLVLFWSCSDAGTERAYLEEKSLTYGSLADTTTLLKATFAGGCFWCTEAYFERLQGVDRVVSGYTGGTELYPTYQQVSGGRTSHAEAIQLWYNPSAISYQELLEVFFATHDPTTLNRQGPDVGKQYRSAIYYHNESQRKEASQYISELNDAGTFRKKIVTQLEPVKRFWVAEEYHQDYYRRNPRDPYVVSIARPKVKKFEAAYRNKLKKSYLVE
jgi:peptide-methionine (S)-S-oxide reductase